ncbi:hypothetical protein BBJ28_00003374 [Nothophytophthora sp. Chile5]|nr:hypothetical protein BBJ28_00003374 [Nothophytophthora sp. Chile5]
METTTPPKSEAAAPATCPICGTAESLRRCGACKRVSYCSREHQRQHWKKHRAECARPSEKPESAANAVVVVEIKRGEGGGLTNPMVNHVFDSLERAESFIRVRLGVSELRTITDLPFLTDFMAFRSPKLYLNPAVNQFFPPSQPFPRVHGHGELNAMAIYLGSRLSDGLSPYVNASGDAFFVGTTAQYQPVTSNVLWGAANFLYEAMDYYGDEDVTEQQRVAIFRKWGQRYGRGTWEPNAGTGGIDVYQTDPFQSRELLLSRAPAAALEGTPRLSGGPASDMVVVVEIKSGEKDFMANSMANHVFDSNVRALSFIRSRFGVSEEAPLKFLTEFEIPMEFMRFQRPKLYLDLAVNKFMPRSYPFVRSHGHGELNAIASNLGCRISDGLSPYVLVSGDAFFMGTTAQYQPVTSTVLWGAINFLNEAMAYYRREGVTEQQRVTVFRKWGQRYSLGTWEPNAGTGGINIYQTDPFNADDGVSWTTARPHTVPSGPRVSMKAWRVEPPRSSEPQDDNEVYA